MIELPNKYAKHQKTTLLVIERPLVPQPPPPDQVRPFFYFGDRLCFYYKDQPTVKAWDQVIPELKLCRYDNPFAGPVFNISVRYDGPGWGWQLVAETTHEFAKLFAGMIMACDIEKISRQAHRMRQDHDSQMGEILGKLTGGAFCSRIPQDELDEYLQTHGTLGEYFHGTDAEGLDLG